MLGEKISITTISFNAGMTVEKTFQSILTQSYRPLEYVLVDGGSSDGTIEIVSKYIPIFEKVGIEVQFISEPDRGISDAFNKGIGLATGTILGIINADDCLGEDVLRDIAAAFDENVDVLCGDCLWNDVGNNVSYVRKSQIGEISKLKYKMVLMHPACFVRKSAYEKYGVFDIDLKYVMDKDLMARFYRSGANFKYIPRVLAIMSAGGVSDANVRKVFDEGVIVGVRNGVPIWILQVRNRVMLIRMWAINRLKKMGFLWRLIKENNIKRNS